MNKLEDILFINITKGYLGNLKIIKEFWVFLFNFFIFGFFLILILIFIFNLI